MYNSSNQFAIAQHKLICVTLIKLCELYMVLVVLLLVFV